LEKKIAHVATLISMRMKSTIRTMGPPACRLRPMVEEEPMLGAFDSILAETAVLAVAARGGASRLAKHGLARRNTKQRKCKTLFIKNFP